MMAFTMALILVKWCRENITVRHPSFHFHHADLSNTLYRGKGRRADQYVFPFPDETFDVVFATSVFTHLVPASAHQYAREIARLLKSGKGRALVTFYLTSPAARFPHQCDGYSVGWLNNPEAVVAYEENVARRMLEDASLTIEDLSLGNWSHNQGWTWQDVFLLSATH
jgi:SAM-dependent methyltransferase